jgi:ariadne-1
LSDTEIGSSYQLECGHRTCADCLSSHITTKIDSNEVAEDQLTCPHLACTTPIPPVTIGECCRADTFQKFADFRADRFIQAGTLHGDIRRCPGGSCDFAFEPYPGAAPQDFSCPKCKQRFCLKCVANDGADGPGHAGRTCAARRAELDREVDERRRHEEWRAANAGGDAALQGLAARAGWRACPRCAELIERNGGCDHMTCRGCRCSFCYVCGKWNKQQAEARGDCGTTCRARPGPAAQSPASRASCACAGHSTPPAFTP